jgi:hypothetical protein
VMLSDEDIRQLRSDQDACRRGRARLLFAMSPREACDMEFVNMWGGGVISVWYHSIVAEAIIWFRRERKTDQVAKLAEHVIATPPRPVEVSPSK